MSIQKLFRLGIDWAQKHHLVLALCAFLICVPFNIFLHLDDTWAYLDGRYVNYLHLGVHLTDLGALLLLFVWTSSLKLWKSNRIRVIFLLLGLLIVWQALYWREVLVIVSVLRMALYFGLTAVIFYSLGLSRLVRFDRRDLLILFVVIVALTVMQVAIGAGQFFSGHSLGLDFIGESTVATGGSTGSSVYLADGYHLRAYGTFPHPNMLGGYLCLMILLVWVLSEKLRLRTVTVLPIVMTFVLGILMTWSRTSLLIGAIVLVTWLLSSIYRNHRHLLIPVIATLSFITILSFTILVSSHNQTIASFRERIINQTSPTDVSVIERKELAVNAIIAWRKSPILGVGVGNSLPVLMGYPVYTEGGVRVFQPPHNIFIIALLELGIVGVVFLSFFFLKCLHSFRLSVIAFVAIVFVLVAGMLDHYLWTLSQGLGFWAILVFGVALIEPYVERKHSVRR